MRAIWKGGISFGLVYIPVRLYSAAPASKSLDFKMLRKGDHCPIKYVRVCKSTGEEVPWEDIVKGYEYQKGDYIVLQDEDFKKVSPKKTKTIDLEDFVDVTEIDPKYFEKPYFIEPEPQAAKTYRLLMETLKKSGKAGIARFVLRNRQHLGMLTVEDEVIYLTQLRFADELRSEKKLDIPEGDKPSKKEIDMALNLVEQMTTEFKPRDYKDTYREDVLAMIEKRAKNKKARVTINEDEEVEETAGKDLMAQLKASLDDMKKSAA